MSDLHDPCRRAACVIAARFAAQDAQARAIAAGDDPVDVLADGLPDVATHSGGAHLDPDEMAELSDRLTRAIREHDLSAAASVRDRLDALAGREPWKHSDPPRPEV